MKSSKAFLHTRCCTFLILVGIILTLFSGQAWAAPVKDTDGFYMIETAEDLSWLRDGVNDGTIASSDADAKLMNDIDMGGVGNWVPIGYYEGREVPGISLDRRYASTFDGRLYTISNLTISAPSSNPSLYYHGLGLFGSTAGAAIRNLHLKDVDIDADVTAQTVTTTAGAVAGDAQRSTLIENCHVFGGTVKISSSNTNGLLAVRAGGIAGSSERSTVIQNCVVSDMEIGAASNVGSALAGGVAAMSYGTGVLGDLPTVIRSCLVKDCAITADSPNNTKTNNWSAAVGGIAGDYSFSASNTSVLENCVSQNNTLLSKSQNYAHAGGIAGMSLYGIVRNCTVSGGSITAQSATGAANRQIMGALIGDASFVSGSYSFYSSGLLSNGTDNALGEDIASSIKRNVFDYGTTSPDQLPFVTVLLNDVMKVVEEGESADLHVVTYPGTGSDVTYAWDQDYDYVSLSALSGDSIDVTGVTVDEVDYVECIPTANTGGSSARLYVNTFEITAPNLRCAFRVDAVPVPPTPPCEGDCGSGCSALPFEWLMVLLLPCAVYFLVTKKNWIS